MAVSCTIVHLKYCNSNANLIANDFAQDDTPATRLIVFPFFSVHCLMRVQYTDWRVIPCFIIYL